MVNMTITDQPRQQAGAPSGVGGQFKSHTRGDAEVQLEPATRDIVVETRLLRLSEQIDIERVHQQSIDRAGEYELDDEMAVAGARALGEIYPELTEMQRLGETGRVNQETMARQIAEAWRSLPFNGHRLIISMLGTWALNKQLGS